MYMYSYIETSHLDLFYLWYKQFDHWIFIKNVTDL